MCFTTTKNRFQIFLQMDYRCKINNTASILEEQAASDKAAKANYVMQKVMSTKILIEMI